MGLGLIVLMDDLHPCLDQHKQARFPGMSRDAAVMSQPKIIGPLRLNQVKDHRHRVNLINENPCNV